jgi:hypothetical protein
MIMMPPSGCRLSMSFRAQDSEFDLRNLEKRQFNIISRGYKVSGLGYRVKDNDTRRKARGAGY